MAAGDGVRVLLQEQEAGFDVTVGRAGPRRACWAWSPGVLSMHRLEVRSAVTQTVGDRAVEVWSVNPLFGDPPAVDRLREDIRRASSGQLDVAAAAGSPGRGRARGPDAPDAAARPRRPDRRARRAGRPSWRCAPTTRPACCTGSAWRSRRPGRTSRRRGWPPSGSEVVDVFYLVDRRGDALAPDLAQAVAEAVAEALEAPSRR